MPDSTATWSSRCSNRTERSDSCGNDYECSNDLLRTLNSSAVLHSTAQSFDAEGNLMDDYTLEPGDVDRNGNRYPGEAEMDTEVSNEPLEQYPF